MGKVAQVLITGYWPDRVPRRIGVPQKPLGEQYLAAARNAGEAVALRTPKGVLTHAALLAEVRILAAGLAALAEVRSTIALAATAQGELLALMLAGQVAGCRTALLDASTPESLARGIVALSPDLVVCGTGVEPPTGAARCVALDDVRAAATGSGERRTRWRDVAVLLPEGDDFAGHGHVSTTAMIKALVTYIPLLETTDFVCTGPLYRWDAFAGALTAILSGRGVILDPDATVGWAPSEAHAFLSRREADALVRADRAPAWTSRLRLLFVVMAEFEPRWRRKLEGVLRRPILPLWGTQRTGPAICAHPSWAPVDVHGLPLTNAMLIPLNPANGEPSDVPWEMLSRAELGIEAPSVQIKDPGSEGIVFDWNGNQVARTGRIVAVDRLGMVRFLDAG